MAKSNLESLAVLYTSLLRVVQCTTKSIACDIDSDDLHITHILSYIFLPKI